MKVVLVALSLLATTASCVTSNEDSLFLDGPVSATPTPSPEPSPTADSQIAPTPTPTPLFTPTPEPQPITASLPISPPVDPATQGSVLPLPRDTTQITVHSFLRDYRPAYVKYSNLLREYRAYFLGVTTPSETDEAGKNALKARVREDLERAHWAFVHGCEELIEYLSADARGTLVSDREENFVARMKTLVFMAKELSEVSGDKKYGKFVRELYVRQSENHFGRKLAPLKEPEGPSGLIWEQ